MIAYENEKNNYWKKRKSFFFVSSSSLIYSIQSNFHFFSLQNSISRTVRLENRTNSNKIERERDKSQINVK